MEDSEDELLDLLTCHRSAPCLEFPACRRFQSAVPRLLGMGNNFADPLLLTQASLGPFPWQMKGQVSAAPGQFHCASRSTSDPQPKWLRCLNDDILRLARTKEVFNKIETDPILSYRLPSPTATAGTVLHHAAAVFEGLQHSFKPMSFKFGFTHCAHFRWYNTQFGYKYENNKFQQMIVVYVAALPVGPAFLEAALIDRYQGYLPR